MKFLGRFTSPFKRSPKKKASLQRSRSSAESGGGPPRSSSSPSVGVVKNDEPRRRQQQPRVVRRERPPPPPRRDTSSHDVRRSTVGISVAVSPQECQLALSREDRRSAQLESQRFAGESCWVPPPESGGGQTRSPHAQISALEQHRLMTRSWQNNEQTPHQAPRPLTSGKSSTIQREGFGEFLRTGGPIDSDIAAAGRVSMQRWRQGNGSSERGRMDMSMRSMPNAYSLTPPGKRSISAPPSRPPFAAAASDDSSTPLATSPGSPSSFMDKYRSPFRDPPSSVAALEPQSLAREGATRNSPEWNEWQARIKANLQQQGRWPQPQPQPQQQEEEEEQEDQQAAKVRRGSQDHQQQMKLRMQKRRSSYTLNATNAAGPIEGSGSVGADLSDGGGARSPTSAEQPPNSAAQGRDISVLLQDYASKHDEQLNIAPSSTRPAVAAVDDWDERGRPSPRHSPQSIDVRLAERRAKLAQAHRDKAEADKLLEMLAKDPSGDEVKKLVHSIFKRQAARQKQLKQKSPSAAANGTPTRFVNLAQLQASGQGAGGRAVDTEGSDASSTLSAQHRGGELRQGRAPAQRREPSPSPMRVHLQANQLSEVTPGRSRASSRPGSARSNRSRRDPSPTTTYRSDSDQSGSTTISRYSSMSGRAEIRRKHSGPSYAMPTANKMHRDDATSNWRANSPAERVRTRRRPQSARRAMPAARGRFNASRPASAGRGRPNTATSSNRSVSSFSEASTVSTAIDSAYEQIKSRIEVDIDRSQQTADGRAVRLRVAKDQLLSEQREAQNLASADSEQRYSPKKDGARGSRQHVAMPNGSANQRQLPTARIKVDRGGAVQQQGRIVTGGGGGGNMRQTGDHSGASPRSQARNGAGQLGGVTSTVRASTSSPNSYNPLIIRNSQQQQQQQQLPQNGAPGVVADWIATVDPASKRPYYYSPSTGRTTWTLPSKYRHQARSPYNVYPSAQVTSTASGSININGGNFNYWMTALDASTGRNYYYNTLTRETRWDPPSRAPPRANSPAPSSANSLSTASYSGY